MHDRDSLHRFMFEHFPIRGHLVHLDASWLALIEHRVYPEAIRNALGETVAAALLLAATIKFDGVLSLQLQGPGPVHLMLAQCTSGLAVRGLARYASEIDEGTATVPGGIEDMVGPGNLTVTVESEDRSQRYQGIVPISGVRVADSLQAYFENSEQIPTRLWVHADELGVSGMLLQRLPSVPGASVAAGAPVSGEATTGGLIIKDAATAAIIDESAIDDAWRRVQLIGATLTPEELRSLSDAQILHRLYHEDDVRLYEASPVSFRCRCSRDRVSGMLQGLGEVEIRSIIAERGEVEVRCDFCNRAYAFDAVDVERLFNSNVAGDAGGSVH